MKTKSRHFPRLEHPGKIIHLRPILSGKKEFFDCCSLLSSWGSSDRIFAPFVVPRDYFHEIHVSPTMVVDHLPNRYVDQLQQLIEDWSEARVADVDGQVGWYWLMLQISNMMFDERRFTLEVVWSDESLNLSVGDIEIELFWWLINSIFLHVSLRLSRRNFQPLVLKITGYYFCTQSFHFFQPEFLVQN